MFSKITNDASSGTSISSRSLRQDKTLLGDFSFLFIAFKLFSKEEALKRLGSVDVHSSSSCICQM